MNKKKRDSQTLILLCWLNLWLDFDHRTLDVPAEHKFIYYGSEIRGKGSSPDTESPRYLIQSQGRIYGNMVLEKFSEVWTNRAAQRKHMISLQVWSRSVLISTLRPESWNLMDSNDVRPAVCVGTGERDGITWGCGNIIMTFYAHNHNWHSVCNLT